jgi:hypothetical protein
MGQSQKARLSMVGSIVARAYHSSLRSLPAGVRILRGSLNRRSLRIVLPASVALLLLPFLLALVPLEIKEPLFGDTLVYLYMGWCVRHGLKIYRDVGMMDGPFIHFLMAGMQLFSGFADRSFRICDLIVHACGSAVIGALLAPTAGLTRPARISSRVAWATLTSTVWLCCLLTQPWWNTTQRETYYSLFGSIGMVALFASRNFAPTYARAAIFLGALLTTTQIFGKPTGIMYPVLGSLCLMLEDAGGPLPVAIRCRTFVAGMGLCVFAALIAIGLAGSFRGYLFWCFNIPYRQSRFLFGVEGLQLFLANLDGVRAAALLAPASGLAAIACGLLPARALGFALLPPIAFVGYCLQNHASTYQAIPVEAGALVLALVMLTSVWPRHDSNRWFGWRGPFAMASLLALGYHAFQDVETSPYRWSGDKTHWSAPCSHHFGDAEREVGLYIKAHTRPGDAGFACCDNSHVILLYAERPTASPFFHGIWLDSVAFLPLSNIQPNARELAALTTLQTKIRDIACTAVEQNKPSWMAFGNLGQVYGICPKLRTMLESDYVDAATVQGFHVYQRKTPG